MTIKLDDEKPYYRSGYCTILVSVMVRNRTNAKFSIGSERYNSHSLCAPVWDCDLQELWRAGGAIPMVCMYRVSRRKVECRGVGVRQRLKLWCPGSDQLTGAWQFRSGQSVASITADCWWMRWWDGDQWEIWHWYLIFHIIFYLLLYSWKLFISLSLSSKSSQVQNLSPLPSRRSQLHSRRSQLLSRISTLLSRRSPLHSRRSPLLSSQVLFHLTKSTPV